MTDDGPAHRAPPRDRGQRQRSLRRSRASRRTRAIGRRQARRLPAQDRALSTRRHLVVAAAARPRGRGACSAARRVPLTVDPRYIELDFGEAHALTWEEIAEAGIPFNYRSADEPVAPGGESRNQLAGSRRRRGRRGVRGRRAPRHRLPRGRHACRSRAHAGPERRSAVGVRDPQRAACARSASIDGHGLLEEYRAGLRPPVGRLACSRSRYLRQSSAPRALARRPRKDAHGLRRAHTTGARRRWCRTPPGCARARFASGPAWTSSASSRATRTRTARFPVRSRAMRAVLPRLNVYPDGAARALQARACRAPRRRRGAHRRRQRQQRAAPPHRAGGAAPGRRVRLRVAELRGLPDGHASSWAPRAVKVPLDRRRWSTTSTRCSRRSPSAPSSCSCATRTTPPAPSTHATRSRRSSTQVPEHVLRRHRRGVLRVRRRRRVPQRSRLLRRRRAASCVLRTFSKIYSLAGARVGYGVLPGAAGRGGQQGPRAVQRQHRRPGRRVLLARRRRPRSSADAERTRNRRPTCIRASTGSASHTCRRRRTSSTCRRRSRSKSSRRSLPRGSSCATSAPLPRSGSVSVLPRTRTPPSPPSRRSSRSWARSRRAARPRRRTQRPPRTDERGREEHTMLVVMRDHASQEIDRPRRRTPSRGRCRGAPVPR